MTEELAFKELARDRRAIDRYHCALAPWAQIMNGAGRQLLSGPGFSTDQNRGIGGSDDANLSQHFRQCLTLAENLAKFESLLYALLEVVVFMFELSLKPFHLLKRPRICYSTGSVIRKQTQPGEFLVFQRPI
jgi:hypothetical protein